MTWLIKEDNRLIKSQELEGEKLKALNDRTRRKILRILQEEESYPAEIAKTLDLPKQKIYYHFEKLEKSGLIEEIGKEEKSGGTATFYSPSVEAVHLEISEKGQKTGFEVLENPLKNFITPLVENGKLNGSIVVGSPDEHGPDQVRARDGHLAGEICLKLGSFVDSKADAVKWDTEIVRENSFDQNMLILGGLLTNTLAREYNEEFPVSFEGESFPYRKLETPKNTYTDPEIGFIAKTSNPESPEKTLLIVAGVRNQGTEAAVKAFKNLEDIIESKKSYIVVEGLDLDGDGKIDDYEILERG